MGPGKTGRSELRRLSSDSRERKMRRPGPSVPPDPSVRRPQKAGASLRCSLFPLGVPPPESPFPSFGPSPVAPPSDLHREVAVLMMRTLHNGCRNRGHIGLRFGCVATGSAIREQTRRCTRREASGRREVSRPRWRHDAVARALADRCWVRPTRAGARETGKPGTRVARRNRFRSKDPS